MPLTLSYVRTYHGVAYIRTYFNGKEDHAHGEADEKEQSRAGARAGTLAQNHRCGTLRDHAGDSAEALESEGLVMSRRVESVPYGSHGQGALVRFDNSPNWFSVYSVRGREHVESTRTGDLKKARRFHKQRLDELATHRQGLKPFIAPLQQRVTVADLLD